MKATYTRKKLLNPLYPKDQVKHAPKHTEDASSTTILSQEDNGYADDSMDHDSIEVVRHPHITSSIQPEDSSIVVGDEPSLTINESAVVANAANAQVLKETVSTIEESSEQVQDEEGDEDEEDDEDDEDEELFDVEYFMADDYRKVLTFIMLSLLLSPV